MILNTLQLRNYKQYQHLNLTFREGLVGIIGRNGAGKSTLFEAILYCLFGREEGNKSYVRSVFSDAKAVVSLELEFSIGELRYRILREFRGKILTAGAELYKNDSLVAKGVSPVNDELVKVLNVERDSFKRSVFSGQKELAELSEATGEVRKKMVRRMLGLDTLDAVQQKVHADVRDLNSQVAGQRLALYDEDTLQGIVKQKTALETELADLRARVEAEQQRLHESTAKRQAEKSRFDEWEARLNRHNALQRDITQLEERKANLERNHVEFSKKKAEITELAEKTARDRPVFLQYEADRKRIDELHAQRQRQLNRDSQLKSLAEHRDRVEDTKRAIAPLEEALEALPALQAQSNDLTARVAAFQSQRDALKERYDALGNQWSALQERSTLRQKQAAQLREIGHDGTCPTCFQPVRDAYEDVLAQLQREIADIEQREQKALEAQREAVVSEGKAVKKEQETAEAALRQAAADLAEIDLKKRQRDALLAQMAKEQALVVQSEAILREIGESNFDTAAFQALREQVQAQEAAWQTFKNEENYVQREASQNLINLKRTEDQQAATAQELTQKQQEQAELAYDPAQYEAAKAALTAHDNVLAAQNEALRALDKQALECSTALQSLNTQLDNHERIQAQISDKLVEIDVLDRLHKHLGQFKTDILDRVSPGISAEASTLFSRITKGKYERIEVDENFEFGIADGGLLYPIQRFSGGEVDLANFCLRIAITKAIMEIGGGQRLEFLAFDEIFGSQDEERRLEIMHALHFLQEQFRQIYIVSHNETLKDFFPNLLEVQQSPEGSMVTWR